LHNPFASIHNQSGRGRYPEVAGGVFQQVGCLQFRRSRKQGSAKV
jgi:hypothetical protein